MHSGLPKLRNAWFGFLLCLAACCIALLSVEVYLRFYKFHSLLVPKYPLLKDFVVPDPDAGYDLAVNKEPAYMYYAGGKFLTWTNELACFDTPYKGEKEYILLAGDSCAWGFAPYQKKVGTVMEDILHTRVVKAGVLGYGTRQELVKARKVLAQINHPPRAIVLLYCLSNDFMDDYLFPRYAEMEGFLATKSTIISCVTGEKYVFPDDVLAKRAANIRSHGSIYDHDTDGRWPLVVWLRTHSVLFQELSVNRRLRAMLRPFGLVRRDMGEPTIKGVKLEGPQEDVPDVSRIQESPALSAAWQAHLATLAGFKETADGQGSRLLVVLIPSKQTVYPCLPDPNGISRKEQALIGALKEYFNGQGIEYLDLLPEFLSYAAGQKGCNRGPGALFYRDDGHWSALANVIAAQKIAAYLEKK